MRGGRADTVRGGVAFTELRGLWDSELRKGKNLLPLAPRLKPFYLELRNARKGTDFRRLEEAREAWDRELEVFLARLSEEIRDSIAANRFSWGVTRGREFHGKPTFKLTHASPIYFTERVIAAALASRAEVRRPDRSLAVQQVARSIGDNLPKSVLRSDIQSFFESIPHDQLLEAIDRANALSEPLLNLVQRFLKEYEVLVGTARGVPRGTALGAALAEFYLLPLDRFMKIQPNTLLHVRYVDDVIIVVGEPNQHGPSQVVGIRDGLVELLDTMGLRVNSAKTQITAMQGGQWSGKIEYLGYELTPGRHSTTISISSDRIGKIRARLTRTFERWASASGPADEGLLIDRVRLLTGNTRLQYNKQKAMVGIFFSNRDATSIDELRGLDAYLRYLVKSASLSARAEAVIAALSFEAGFTDRRFKKFSTKRLRDMKGAWNA